MTEKRIKIIRLCYFGAVTLALALAAVLLMVACVTIYRTGDHPFTREVVAAEFGKIAIPVFVALGLVVLGFILSPLLPDAPPKAADMNPTVLRRLQGRTDLSACPAEMVAGIRKERRLRYWLDLSTLVLLMVGIVLFLWYALDVGHFHQSEINASMIAAMKVLAPCMGIPFLCYVVAAYLKRGSVKREITVYKQAPKEALSPAPAPVASTEKWVLVVRYALLSLAVGAIIHGLLADGWMDVLTKAINICTECIGLG